MTKKARARLSKETFDEFLDEQGLLAQVEESALKEVIADQIKAAMSEQKLTKTAMAAAVCIRDRRRLTIACSTPPTPR